MLYNGERIGDGSPPESTSRSIRWRAPRLLRTHAGALAVIALSRRGTMFDPGPCVYMEEDAGSPRSPTCSTLTPAGRDREADRRSQGTAVGDVMVLVLDRPRHEQGIAAIRAAGARVRLIPHGDVSAALLAVTERSPVDLLWASAARRRGSFSAAAVKCLGGQLLGGLLAAR